MNDMTLGLIYAIKHREDQTMEEAAVDFLSNYTDTPKQQYNQNVLRFVLRVCFSDYIGAADHPSSVMEEFFKYCDKYGEIQGILTTLELVKVRDHGKYVNGFRDLEEVS